MNKEDCVAFIGHVNALALYVPPILMKALAECRVSAMIAGIANGQVTVNHTAPTVEPSTPSPKRPKAPKAPKKAA